MKLINTKWIGALLLFALFVTSCKEEKLYVPDYNHQREVLKSQEHELDKWIMAEYTNPYNIEVIWRWNTKETSYRYNYIPPVVDNVKPYLMILKGTFIKTYEEVMGKSFIKPLIPKQFHLLGEWGYKPDGSITLGQAETGSKFTFYGVNHWRDQDAKGDYPWIRDAVHTMFHEFGHILHQNKKFTEEFEKVTKEYYTSNWTNETELAARVKGYASNYSMLNKDEDFVELIAFYITLKPDKWEERIDEGVKAAKEGKKVNEQDPSGKPIKMEDALKGKEAIKTKIQMVKNYLKSTWDIDLDRIREVAQKNAEACYKNPEILPQSTTSSPSTAHSVAVMSPFAHNCTYCNKVISEGIKTSNGHDE